MDERQEYEGTFFHRSLGTELNIMFDGKTAFITIYNTAGKAVEKIIVDVNEKSKHYLNDVLKEYRREK